MDQAWSLVVRVTPVDGRWGVTTRQDARSSFGKVRSQRFTWMEGIIDGFTEKGSLYWALKSGWALLVRWGIGRERHDKEKDTMKFMEARKRRESMEKDRKSGLLGMSHTWTLFVSWGGWNVECSWIVGGLKCQLRCLNFIPGGMESHWLEDTIRDWLYARYRGNTMHSRVGKERRKNKDAKLSNL